ncbi:ribonuclease HII [Arachidicoccus ginsenosidivorans]|uniref:Ribonuclease HII n=1 Tax=Arachidicoccus ginsenosidivorans TaxID=496057 RepID=A0A5B8VLY3_9BACT|nr:ribonuclease HII [Arachidicoccus ginsenosidivorans]
MKRCWLSAIDLIVSCFFRSKGSRLAVKKIGRPIESLYFCQVLINSFQNKVLEAGCDEAGRGCYAGPVFAAAVILPKDFYHEKLNDSKQVPEKDRDLLRAVIEQEAICYSVARVDVAEIDSINILKASIKAMHLAIHSLNKKPRFLAIDGNRFTPFPSIKHICVIKGDGKYANIAAASILAKTYRDDYMKDLHTSYPRYGWASNKGYGTAFHREAIKAYGLCEHHRKSFNINPDIPTLF